MPGHPPPPLAADAHLHEPLLYSGDPIDSTSEGPIEVGEGHDGRHTPSMGPPRLRGLPLLFLSRGAQVYAGRAPFTDRTTYDDLVNREEVRAAERRATQGQDPLPDAFVFFNEARTEVKVLLWSDRGFTVLHQVLHDGMFALPRPLAPGEKIPVEALGQLFSGPARAEPQSMSLS